MLPTSFAVIITETRRDLLLVPLASQRVLWDESSEQRNGHSRADLWNPNSVLNMVLLIVLEKKSSNFSKGNFLGPWGLRLPAAAEILLL